MNYSMSRIMNTEINSKLRFENQNCVSDSEQDGLCYKNLQPSENSSSELDSFSESIYTNFQSNEDCRTGFNSSLNCIANFVHSEISPAVTSDTENLQTQNCHKDTYELPQTSLDLQHNPNPQNIKTQTHTSVDLQENLHLKLNIPPDYNISRSDDSDSVESQDSSADSQQHQNHPSDCLLEEDLNIRTKICDMHSDAKDCHEQSHFESELHMKTESCETLNRDSDSHPIMSDMSTGIKTHSESFENSNEDCDRDMDHSGSSSMMEVIKNENPDTENRVISPQNPDLKRSRRNSKRKREMEDQCPVCGVTIRYSDLESHFAKEVENLSNVAKNLRKNRVSHKEREGFRRGINLAFVQAKCNRENRLAAKREKYVNKHEIFCPVCKTKISGTDEEVNRHVLSCFGEDEDSDINITDYDENFEEYEFGNETRIRAISLVPGGHSALHGHSSKITNDEDDGADINVDVDDTLSFGKPQELDVIHNTSSTSNEKEEQLRRAVTSDLTAKPHVIESKKWSKDDIQNDIDEIIGSCDKNKIKDRIVKEEEEEDMNVQDDCKDGNNVDEGTESKIISTLRKRIKDLEEQQNVKCLICLEPYTRPVVSTTCWHVHCEECWLVSMGVKKLCPQCNMIVFPTDLRRIYL